MKTIIFSLKLNDEDKEMIKYHQKSYSIAFRKCYNNLELLKDENFINEINNLIKSKRQQEYLIKEVLSFKKKNDSSKERILENIEKLEALGNEISPKEFKRLQRLKKSYKSNLVFGGKHQLKRRTKGLISKDEWQKGRLLPLIFYGEKHHKGSRFFDFKDILNGNLLFKLEATKVKINLNFSTKKHLKELKKLLPLILNKEIPITVKLTSNKLYLSYDESILHNSNFDYKLFYKDAPKNKLEKKAFWIKKYQEHENHLKYGKLERFLGIDLNPNTIGFCVIDKSTGKILEKGCFEITEKVSQDKRKYELSIIIKELFKKIEHYRCSYFVIEDLELKQKNFGNKVSNRKVKNEWCLEYLKNLITRRCNETKTILRKVNPAFSSFIGNLQYKIYDPISSSMEICRRSLYQFDGGFYPEFNLNNFMNAEKYCEIDLGSINSWKALYYHYKSRKWSWRVKTKSFVGNLYNYKSKICLYS